MTTVADIILAYYIITWTCTALGFFVLLHVLHALSMVLVEYVRSFKKEKEFVLKYGKWAVITGCTDGIGKAYMKELAKEGMNIVLISRSIKKLKECAQDVEETFNVETEIIQADFTDGRKIYKQIEDCLQNKEIGVLVNNVGITGDSPKWFDEFSEDEIWDLINVNVASVPVMTKIVLPSMIKRGRGAIVNVSSLASLANLSVASVYSASKAFVDSFSQCLSEDVKSKGIEVQCLLPSWVATNMLEYSSVGKPGILSPTSSDYTSQAIATVGLTRRTSGYWSHNITKYFLENSISRPLLVKVSNMIWENIMKEKKENGEEKKK